MVGLSPAVTGISLSRQSWPSSVATWALGSRQSQERAIERPVCAQHVATTYAERTTTRALCTRPTCDSVQCGALFGSLFTDTVHKHCLKKKKKYKIYPQDLGCHRRSEFESL